MKAAINSTLIKNLPEGQDMDIYDTKLTGFALRLRKSGKHSYRVNYARGKWYTLGRVTDLKPAEAREQAIKILGDVAKGSDPAASRKREKAATLRQYFREVYIPWADSHHSSGKATMANLRPFEREMGNRKLHEITAWLVEKWRSERLKAGIKPATVNRNLGALKAALNRAVEWGIIEYNPLAKVKPAKLDQKGIVRYLSDDEETRLRKALIDREARIRAERESANKWRSERGYPVKPEYGPCVDYVRPIILLALNTGMRRGEIFNLEWSDIQNKVLTVKGGGAKSGQTRHIPLNDEAAQILADWKASTQSDKGLVFTGREGGRLDNINKSWRRIMVEAAITDFRFHDLRHTFASRLVMAGVDLNTVRELLGHSDLKMTLRYAHLAPEHKAEAVARLNKGAS